jgi:plasmid maintenance system antidote protein VapI
MSDSEKIDLASVLEKAVGHTFSDNFWINVQKSNKELNDQMREKERSLRPSWESLHRPFDL